MDFDFVRGADGTQLIKSNNPKIQLKFLYYFLSNSNIENAERYERHFKYLKDMWIPLADGETQEYFIRECEAVDKEVEEARNEIANAKEQIEQIISGVQGESKTLHTVAPFATDRIAFDNISRNNYITTDNMLQDFEGVRQYDGEPQTGNTFKRPIVDKSDTEQIEVPTKYKR